MRWPQEIAALFVFRARLASWFELQRKRLQDATAVGRAKEKEIKKEKEQGDGQERK